MTICCKNRVCWFGDVLEGKIVLSSIRQIAESEWLKTFDMRPDMNLMKGEYIIMPNHFHAVIGIGDNQFNTNSDAQHKRRDALHCDSTVNNLQSTISKK